MLIPIYAQKLLTTDYVLWGINSQYSIEFAPVLSLGIANFIKKIKSNKIVYFIVILTTFLTIFYNYRTIESRKSLWYNKTNTAFYKNQHYSTPFNVKEIYNQIEKIPDDAIISVSTNLAPHLSFRKKIYHFPIVKNADYILLLTSNTSFYPLNEEEYRNKITHYLNLNIYEKQYNKNSLLILKRRE